MNLLQMIAAEKKGLRARAQRRAFPIHMYVGRNGAGKSVAAVYDTLPDLDGGAQCLSTVRLLDYTNPRECDDILCEDVMHGRPGHMAAHPGYVPFTGWQQLLEWSNGPVLMDEITGVADSNESAAIPPAAANKLAQLRRDDCTVRITGLNFIRAHKRIREAVNAVTRCQSILPVTTLAEDGTERLWRQRRFAIWSTFDAQSLPLDDISEAAWEKGDKLAKAFHWIPESPAIRAYDTYAPVSMVGTVSDAGRCAHCGGTRRNPECSCHEYQNQKRRGRSAAPQARSGEDGSSAPALDHDCVSGDSLAPIPAKAG